MHLTPLLDGGRIKALWAEKWSTVKIAISSPPELGLFCWQLGVLLTRTLALFKWVPSATE